MDSILQNILKEKNLSHLIGCTPWCDLTFDTFNKNVKKPDLANNM